MKKLTAQIASAYYGCTVAQFIDTENAVYGKLVSINSQDCCIVMDAKTQSHWSIDKCKLVLTRISDITTEHASICASMCGLHMEGNNVTRMPNAVYIQNDTARNSPVKEAGSYQTCSRHQ